MASHVWGKIKLVLKNDIYVSMRVCRYMYLLKKCQRLLQRPARELLEAPEIREESFRPVDVVVLEETMQMETEANMEDEARDDMSENTMQDDDCDEDENMEASHASSEDEASPLGAAQTAATAAHVPAEEQMESGASSSAAQSAVQRNNAGNQVSAEQPAAEDHSDYEEANPEEAPRTKGLLHTASAHDDWLHRGPFLYDFDLHTYVRYVHRVPRPRKPRNEETQRRMPLFLFDSHYVLAQQYVQ